MKIQVKFSKEANQNFKNLKVTVKNSKLLVFDNVKDFLFDRGDLTLTFTNDDDALTVDNVVMFGTVD